MVGSLVQVAQSSMTTISDLYALIIEAAERRDGEALRKSAYDLETFMMYGDGTAVEEAASCIMDLTALDYFLRTPGAWHVLFAVRHDVERLSAEQRRRLFEAIIEAYPRFSDWMSRFVISELLEYFPTSEAVDAMRLHVANDDPGVRRYLSHGFEHIAYGASDATVRHDALFSVARLLKDADAEVRKEAEDALRRVISRGGAIGDAAEEVLAAG